MKLRKPRKGLDQAYYEAVIEILERAKRHGLTEEQVGELIAKVGDSFMEVSVPKVVARLRKTMPKMLRRHRRRHKKFERHLRRRWGSALDLYYAVVVAAEEAGQKFLEEVDGENPELNFNLIEALAGLHARSCRTALEVYHLLISGLAMGALARSRTLHELAVMAGFLADYGARPEYADLAERYLAHDIVLNYKDLVTYQENADALGYEKFSDAEVDEIKGERDYLRDKYGKPYLGDNGWAAVVFDDRNPQFRELEEKAQLSHRRGHYKWASHEVHADSKGWRLNKVDLVDGTPYMSTGYAGAGLADPADLALMSLVNTTISLMFSDDVFAPSTLVGVKAIMALYDEAADELIRCHELAEQDEEEFIARLNEGRTER